MEIKWDGDRADAVRELTFTGAQLILTGVQSFWFGGMCVFGGACHLAAAGVALVFPKLFFTAP